MKLVFFLMIAKKNSFLIFDKNWYSIKFLIIPILFVMIDFDNHLTLIFVRIRHVFVWFGACLYVLTCFDEQQQQ